MKIGFCVFGFLFIGAACSDKPTASATTTAPQTTATATPPAAAAAAPSFAGSCTVTVTVAGTSTVVCTDHIGLPDKVQEQCTKAATADAKTSFAAGHCPTAGLVGKCAAPNGSTDYYYQPSPVEPVKLSCTNRSGTWSNP